MFSTLLSIHPFLAIAAVEEFSNASLRAPNPFLLLPAGSSLKINLESSLEFGYGIAPEFFIQL